MSASIEEVTSDHSHSDHEGHDHAHDHAHDHDHDLGDAASLDKIQSRAERKARKALLGMGLKRVPGINRVLLVVAQPDVYKSQNSDCYIVFGEAKIDEGQAGLTAQLAQQSAAAAAKAEEEDDDEVPALEPVEDDEEVVDETGIDSNDIEMVMSQVGCSRGKAVRALRNSGGDVINAIMAASG